MVALYKDNMIRTPEVITPLLHDLHEGQEVPIVCVICVSGT
jgi:hypothetical protein